MSAGAKSMGMSGPAEVRQRAGLLDWAGVVLLCACAALAALLELLFVPLYVGRVLVPVVVVCAIAGNIALPRLARGLVNTAAAAVLPFLSWLVVVVIIGMVPRPEGDVILPSGGGVEWVAYGVLFGGAVAGTVTCVLTGAAPPGRRPLRR